MSADFEWFTEDDGVEQPPRTRPTREPGGRRWRRLVLLLLALGFVSGLAYIMARRQIAAASAEADSEIRAAFNLVEAAAARSDEDLLQSVLSGREPAWANGYRALVRDGLLFNLEGLGMSRQRGLAQPEEIVLDANLTSAETPTLRTYTILSSQGTTQTVTLRQTSVFRRGRDRWLFSPPDDEFWGERRTSRGQIVALSYHQRDASFANRLLLFLDGKLEQACSELADLNCPADLSIRVRLERNPESLLVAGDVEAILAIGLEVRLPAPSLVGSPISDQDAQALLRGYAAPVLKAFITEHVGWECCDHGRLYLALLDKQLDVLGVQPWPLTAMDYERLLVELPELLPFSLWQESGVSLDRDEGWRGVHAMADYLADMGVSVTAMQRLLSRADDYRDWLAAADLAALSEIEPERSWLAYLFEHSLSGRLASAIPRPEQDIQVACHLSEGSSRLNLLRYVTATGEWLLEGTLPGDGYLVNLPGDDGVVVERFDGPGSQTVQWRAGEGRVLFQIEPGATRELRVIGEIYASGQHLLLADLLAAERNAPESIFYTLKSINCEWPDCQVANLPGLPAWSPDGSETIVMVFDDVLALGEPTTLLLGNEAGEPVSEIGHGTWPFWLDNDTYGFLNNRMEVVAGQAGARGPQVLFTVDELLATLPEEDRPDFLRIVRITSEPDGAGLLAVLATATGRIPQERFFYFGYDSDSNEVWLLMAFANAMPGVSVFDFPEFSPGGQWMAFQVSRRTSGGSEPWSTYIYNVAERQLAAELSIHVSGSGQFDWSADGNWLSRVNDGFLELILPGVDVGGGLPYHELVIHPFSGCDQASWINR